jgi:hypothetical protein
MIRQCTPAAAVHMHQHPGGGGDSGGGDPRASASQWSVVLVVLVAAVWAPPHRGGDGGGSGSELRASVSWWCWCGWQRRQGPHTRYHRFRCGGGGNGPRIGILVVVVAAAAAGHTRRYRCHRDGGGKPRVGIVVVVVAGHMSVSSWWLPKLQMISTISEILESANRGRGGQRDAYQ